MTTVSVHEAKTHLSRLIERVLAGEEVVIARNKEPVVRLVREGPAKKRPLLGALKGRLGDVGDDVWKPWTEDELGLAEWDNKPL
ncbi:type II toxin-antitoxin system prevent-host-death family antitoxin [Sphingomonas sp.]|jgi:prevent-host-death family protein|uniref:type II toxin-antitoxin system Phd/YefM family antitoxin n=1 Tax=Sphingomonas sp. TaxID=28214 RepID=UPI002DE60BF9|nr:type II toxin-antitoxin system prevent-host-death family antitoxin [Sphingomonas sp.]HEV2568506.1 type II toxin-antitoxin system prevent-host-death family antitoxin [Sphingomonas sp.]